MKPSAAPPVWLEVPADSLESAQAAARGGARRLELASALELGGLSPGAGLLAAARSRLALPWHALIRPRAGDFLYTAAELEVMRRDVDAARQAGAAGIAIGFLGADGQIDLKRTREFVQLARPLAVTFHRAFDMAANLEAALEQVIASGVDCLLTSGGSPSAAAGAERIARLVRAARGRLTIMAGGGVTEANARELVQRTGVRALHGGLRVTASSPMRFRNEAVSLGTVAGNEYQRLQVSEARVRALMAAVANL